MVIPVITGIMGSGRIGAGPDRTGLLADRVKHYYSVPDALVGEYVESRRSATTIEIYQNTTRVAFHARSRVRGGTTTLVEHMPASHRKHAEESIVEIEVWGKLIGPCTSTLVRAILDERRRALVRVHRGAVELTRGA